MQQQNMQLLLEVTAFLNLEADLLDHRDYKAWLELWTQTGIYIVPVNHNQTDYKNSLNVAYDDAKMRQMRTERLQSGEAMSTQGKEYTVRTVSRVRLLGEQDDILKVRCAYCLFENNKGKTRMFPANVEFKLRRQEGEFKIEEKVVKILKSNEYLNTVSYLF